MQWQGIFWLDAIESFDNRAVRHKGIAIEDKRSQQDSESSSSKIGWLQRLRCFDMRLSRGSSSGSTALGTATGIRFLRLRRSAL